MWITAADMLFVAISQMKPMEILQLGSGLELGSWVDGLTKYSKTHISVTECCMTCAMVSK